MQSLPVNHNSDSVLLAFFPENNYNNWYSPSGGLTITDLGGNPNYYDWQQITIDVSILSTYAFSTIKRIGIGIPSPTARELP